jgi:two-component system, chemotaxis family, response regulator Rcp1
MNNKSYNTVEILLVEDNPADILMTREAFDDLKIVNALNVVEDGVEALAFLRKAGKYASVQRPDLILLDLNLPRKNGREVLAEMKEDPSLKSIPVVVLTTSESSSDVRQAYAQHANCYVVKPVGFENFARAIKDIHNFWFSLVKLPSKAAYGEDEGSSAAY